MDFREEYKKTAEIINPSAEALQRMKNNVLEQAKASAEKVIPWKKISVIGGSVAACAIIGVAAVRFIPQSINAADMATGTDTSSMVEAESSAAYAEVSDEHMPENENIDTIPADNADIKTAEDGCPEYSLSETDTPAADASKDNATGEDAAGNSPDVLYEQIVFSEDMSSCIFESELYTLEPNGEYYDSTNVSLAGTICEDTSLGILYLVEFNGTELYISELMDNFIGVYIKAE